MPASPDDSPPAPDGQRRRILDAAAAQFAEHGYAATAIDRIAAEAGIGKESFYRHFESREDCYLALFESVYDDAASRLSGACGAPGDEWPQRLAVALWRLFEFAGERPLAVRSCLREALAAGPAAVERYERAQDAFADLLRPGRELTPRGADLPPTLERTLAGGILWMLAQRLETEGRSSLETFFPDALHLLLSPYLGDEAARAAKVVRHPPG